MITDEQLIQRLRSSMHAAAADVYPPPGSLDGISPASRRLRLPSSGVVLTGVAAATALAVAALAIVLLKHAPRAGTQRVTPASVAPRPTSLVQLRSELAILRQPQRISDRLPARDRAAEQRQDCSNCLNVAKVLPGQTRLLTTIRRPRTDFSVGPERIYLVIGTVRRRWDTGLASGWRQPGSTGRGLHLSLVGLTSSRSRVRQPVDELLNYTHRPMPIPALTPRDVLITSSVTVGVVPDGVTRVKWELANPGQRKPITVHPLVHGNVATAPWTRAPRSTQLLNEQFLVGATWYAADGHVVASYAPGVAGIDKAAGH
jgi:hypothetical protein